MSNMTLQSKQYPLCVDMDGTLVHTDTLLEAYLKLFKKRPWTVFQLPLWLRRGKAFVKHRISQDVTLAAETLPYNKEFLSWLKEEHRRGRVLYLATGSDYRIASAVAEHLGIFDKVIASDGRHNRSGSRKAAALVERCGEKQFDYAGNSWADLSVWTKARSAILVNAHPQLIKHVKRVTEVRRIFPRRRLTVSIFLKAIRVRQWVKNLLLFVPLLTAHQWQSAELILQAILGFFAFSFTASSVYLLNDLMDLESDREHNHKKHRPLAAGQFSIHAAVASMAVLLMTAVVLSAYLNPWFYALLGLYIVINLGYSLYFKQTMLVDVLILSLLYVLRLVAGSIATTIPISPWLLSFAALVFISLALVKRTSELVNLTQQNKSKVPGRGYTHNHSSLLIRLGAISGYSSLAVLAIYITSPKVIQLYTHPNVLWFLIPLFFLWINRVWKLTRRGEVHEDPTIFALQDAPSYLIAVSALLVMFLAI